MNNKPTVAISTDFLTAYAALPRQKQGKVTEFFNKFRNDPMHPGINFEKINEGIDKNICSVRIDDTYRGIVVREPESNVYILLWVDHHDEAYAWAKRKKCSINKLTGSVQIFDVQEVIEEQKAIDEPALFANISDEVFEKIGLPEEQLPMIKAIKTLEGLHSLKAAIPEEAFEGLEWLGNGFSVEEVLDTLYPETEKVEVKENDFAAALQTDTNLFVQTGVNSFDAVMVSGNSAAINADTLIFNIMTAFYTACASFMGQNMGAGNRERMIKSYRISLLYSFLAGVIFGGLLVVFGRQFLSLFASKPEVIEAGMERIKIMGFSYALSAFMDCTIAASRGIGKSIVPTIIVIMGSCVFRVIWVYTIFAYFGTIASLYLLYAFSWSITAIAEIIYFKVCFRKLRIAA